MFITAKRIQKEYDISRSTLRKWALEGKLSCRQLPGGKRLYAQAEVKDLLGETQYGIKEERIIYARVSSTNQKEDLTRQISDLQRVYPDSRVISDIGSGLNYQRKGLQALLALVFDRAVQEVVVTHRDRLCRFGSDLIESIFKSHGVRLLVLHQSERASNEELELAEDLLAVVNVFVARNNGRRSANNRKRRRTYEDTQDPALSFKEAEESSQEVVRDL